MTRRPKPDAPRGADRGPIRLRPEAAGREALPPDRRLTAVGLPNGLSCWIADHPRPERVVSVCLRVGSGSLDEEEDERGAAHLLEHMAFRGSANFPPGALGELFASLGTRLGRDHNAATSLDHTTFVLSAPERGGEVLDALLRCLADFAFRLTLDGDELDRERRVVLEEIRAHPRTGAAERRNVLALLWPGSRFADRAPIGTEAALLGLTAGRLRAHYRRWYRPDNATVLAVGDLDPARAERVLRRHFEPWPAAPGPRPRTDPGARPPARTRGATIHAPEAVEGEVRSVGVLPPLALRTRDDFRARLVERLGLWLLNRRLAASAQDGSAPFRAAGVRLSPLPPVGTLATATATGAPERARAMLGALLAELERAARHAPSPAELEGARAALATAARQAAVSEGNRHSRWVLADLEEAVGLAYVPIGKTRAAALVEELLPAVAAEEVRDAVAAGFTAPARLLLGVVPGDPEADVPDDPGLVAVLREVEAAPLPAAPPRVAPERLMRRRPRRPRGGFLDEDEAFGVRSATLPNGVRVHVREMDARRERVFVTVTVAGGRIRERAEDLGVTAAAALAWTQPATLELPSVAIRDHLGARAIALAASVDEDALSLRLAADPAHLEEGLQLVHLLLTRPRVEAAALRRWQDRIRAYAPAQARSLEVLVAERTLALLTGHDPRFGLLTAEQAEAISVKGAQRWLDEAVRTAPVEAALVGHAPADRLLDLAARYLGSLPRRPVRDDALAPLRALAPSAGPLDAALSVRTDSETSAVVVGWRTAPWQEVRTRRVLQMAEQVLLARVRAELREERGLSYSPEASFAPSRAYPAASLLSVSALAAPANAGETERVIVGLVDRLAREGPTEGEMGTLRMQFAGLVRRAREDPRFWSRELADLDYHGGRVADLVGMPVAFAACTAAEMRDVLAGVAGEAGRLAVIGSPARPQP